MDWQNKCILFKGLPKATIEHDLRPQFLTFNTHEKGTTIEFEGNICHSIGVVKTGKVDLQTIYPSGKVLTHVQLLAGDVFGEALLFNHDNRYPLNVVAATTCTIGRIKKDDLLIIFHNYPDVLSNYLTLMSVRLRTLNQKIRNLSLDTLEKRIANYLLHQHIQRGTLLFQTGMSRSSMAKLMGVQRPSLSRSLAKLREQHIIDYQGDAFKIVNIKLLEQLLTE